MQLTFFQGLHWPVHSMSVTEKNSFPDSVKISVED